MNLSQTAVKRPIATIMILLIFMVIGAVSLWQTPLDLLPDISPPVLAVATVFPGSAPQESLSLVTEPIEEAASTISGVSSINSISRENISLVIIQFDWGIDPGDVRDDISTQLELTSLPEGAE